MLHWITDPACSGFIIAYELDRNHVLISNFNVKTRAPICFSANPNSRNYTLSRLGAQSLRDRQSLLLLAKTFHSKSLAIGHGY
jgi:hypothetical protein